MSIAQHPPVTVEEFAKMPDPTDGSRLELVRGEVIVMPPPKGKHGIRLFTDQSASSATTLNRT